MHSLDNDTQRGIPVDRPAYEISELIKPNTPFSRSKIYTEIKMGRLSARKFGRRTVVLADDFRAWVSSLPYARKAALVETASTDGIKSDQPPEAYSSRRR